jgi:hypothetical protein
MRTRGARAAARAPTLVACGGIRVAGRRLAEESIQSPVDEEIDWPSGADRAIDRHHSSHLPPCRSSSHKGVHCDGLLDRAQLSRAAPTPSVRSKYFLANDWPCAETLSQRTTTVHATAPSCSSFFFFFWS